MQPLHICPSSLARIFPSTRARCWTAVVKKDEPTEFRSQQPSFPAESQAVRQFGVFFKGSSFPQHVSLLLRSPEYKDLLKGYTYHGFLPRDQKWSDSSTGLRI